MISRRGGDFYWLTCDCCGEEHLQLQQWHPPLNVSAEKELAVVVARHEAPQLGWRQVADSPDIVGPRCVQALEAKSA